EELFARLGPIAREQGEAHMVYGANMDDLGDHRPGMQAAKAAGVRAPMIEAELWKTEIRALSRELGLPTWDKPSFACLSSRFQYGDAITAEKLRQVDAAEAFLKSLGFRQFRVRHHERLARIELPPGELPRLWEEGRPEAVFCPGKTTEQVMAIVRRLAEAHDNILCTRASPEIIEALRASGLECRVHALARLVVVKPAASDGVGLIAVVSAGTSDGGVA